MAKCYGSESDENMYILEGEKHRHEQFEDSSSTDSTTFSSDDTKELVELERVFPQSTLISASFNYINSIIGSGVIGIPYAFQQAGFGFGLILLLVVAIMTDYSLVLMIRSGYLAGVFSYQGIMEAAFGRSGFILLSFLQFIYPFVAMVSYNVVVGDTVTKVFVRVLKLETSSLFSERKVVIAMASIFVTLPLCLYKDIARLSKVSLFSLACVGFILVAVIIEFFVLYHIIPSSLDAWNFINWNIVPAIGIMTFAFMCHHNTFFIYGSIKDIDQRKWDSVTHFSLATAFLICAAFGIIGYGTFTGFSQGDLLENYCPDNDLINVARIFFSISILLTFPIECLVAREIIENIVLSNIKNPDLVRPHAHACITILLVLAAYLMSTTTDCLGIVLELNGVLTAVPLAYILPALCYLKLEPSPLMSKGKVMPIIVFFFGLIIAVFGVMFILNNYETLGNCRHGKIMEYCGKNATKVV